MNQNNQNNPPFRQAQEGTGSAENQGLDRSAQKCESATHSDAVRQDDDMVGERQHLVNLHDMGAISGRDDYAGGSGDDMTSQSTDEATER